MDEVKKLTQEKINNGGILSILYFDLHAKSKELVKNLGADFVKRLLQKDKVVYAVGEIDEPKGGESGEDWTTSVEVKILTEDLETLAKICMNHSPFSVEVLKPDKLELNPNEMQKLLGEMSATTADYKEYIVENIATPEEKREIERALVKRSEMIKEKREGAGNEK